MVNMPCPPQLKALSIMHSILIVHNLCRSMKHPGHTVSVCIAPDVRHAAQTPTSLNLSLRIHLSYLLPVFF